MRWVLVVTLFIGCFASGLGGCGGDGGPPDLDAPTVPDGPPPVIDAGALDGSFAGEGEVCGMSPGDLDAGALPCEPGLVCCYPCGIDGCNHTCAIPCSDEPGCVDGCYQVP